MNAADEKLVSWFKNSVKKIEPPGRPTHAAPSPARHGDCKNTQSPRRLPSPATKRARDLRSCPRSFDFVRVAHFARDGGQRRSGRQVCDHFYEQLLTQYTNRLLTKGFDYSVS